MSTIQSNPVSLPRPHIAPSMPPIYQIWSPQTGPGMEWQSWSWCHGGQMVQIINWIYATGWDELDLIRRFGIKEGTSRVVKRSKLKILEIRNQRHQHNGLHGDFQLRNLSVKLMDEYSLHLGNGIPDFWIPAGWAKEVMHCMHGGGRQLIMVGDPSDPSGKLKKMAVADENGEGLWYLY